MSRYENLLRPGRLGSMELRNRIVMSPMGDDLGNPDGTVSDRQQAYAEARARGGVALVMLGSVAVAHPTGTSNVNQTGVSDDRFIPGLRGLADAVHGHGGKVALQLTHAGKVGRNDLVAGRPMWVPSIPRSSGGFDPLFAQLTAEEAEKQQAPMRGAPRPIFREMDHDDIATAAGWFAAAVARAREAGIDGCELHAGHGYLIDEFLSPTTNFRPDDYGGRVENRSRFLVDVLTAIRRTVGPDYPVWIRINAHEYLIEGTTLADALVTARLAAAAGADAIHVSTYAHSGRAIGYTEAHTTHLPGKFIEFARAVKGAVDVPVIGVGRIEPDVADREIAAGSFDFVAMGRKLLADADLPNKLGADGRGDRSDDVRPCMYHYRCIGQIFINEGVRCAVNPQTGRENELRLEAAPARRRVLVVGGGPAGMEAARLAALRGHEVVLAEAGERLGGRLAYAARTYDPNADVLRWLTGQVAKLGVDVRLGTQADAAFVTTVGADVVIAAVGATWGRPDVPGIDGRQVLTVDQLGTWLIDGEPLPGSSVVVLGGGRAAMGLADRASEQGHSVTVVEDSAVFAPQLGLPGRWRLIHDIESRGVRLIANSHPVAVRAGEVDIDILGRVETIPADVVLVASSITARPDAVESLAAAGVPVHAVGDCTGAGYIEGAMLDAATLAVTL